MIGKIVLKQFIFERPPPHKKKYGVEISVERKICHRLHVTSLNWSQSRLKQLEK